jgi:ribosomal protein L10
VTLPPFGRLRVSLLSRLDILLMKVNGMRARDVEDLRALAPTADELAFVRRHVARIATKEPEKARDMRAFLDEWEPRR